MDIEEIEALILKEIDRPKDRNNFIATKIYDAQQKEIESREKDIRRLKSDLENRNLIISEDVKEIEELKTELFLNKVGHQTTQNLWTQTLEENTKLQEQLKASDNAHQTVCTENARWESELDIQLGWLKAEKNKTKKLDIELRSKIVIMTMLGEDKIKLQERVKELNELPKDLLKQQLIREKFDYEESGHLPPWCITKLIKLLTN